MTFPALPEPIGQREAREIQGIPDPQGDHAIQMFFEPEGMLPADG